MFRNDGPGRGDDSRCKQKTWYQNSIRNACDIRDQSGARVRARDVIVIVIVIVIAIVYVIIVMVVLV